MKRFGVLIRTLLCFVFLTFGHAARANVPRDSVIDVKTNWTYRWGDPPSDGKFPPLWARVGASNEGWLPTESTLNPKDRADNSVLWLKVKLPQGTQNDPYLYITGADQTVQVFLDGKTIYSFGKMNKRGQVIAGYPYHLIPLPLNHGGKELIFRLISKHVNIGLFGEIQLAPKSAHLMAIMNRDIEKMFIGAVYMLLALFMGFLWLQQRKNHSYLIFAWMLASMGLYIFCRTEMKFMFLSDPLAFAPTMYWIEMLALFNAPAATAAFFVELFGPGTRNMNKHAWKVLLGIAGVLVLLVATHTITLMQSLAPFQISMLTVLIMGLVTPMQLALKRDVEAMIFLGGMLGFLASAVFDVLMAVGIIPRYVLGTTHLGLTLFVAAQATILGRRFVEVHNKIARLKTSLEHILAGTKDLATAREKLIASAKAVHYIMKDISLKNSTATIYFFNRKDPNSLQADWAEIIRDGQEVVSPVSGRIEDFTPLLEGFPILDTGHTALDPQHRLLMPILWGHVRVGFMVLTGYQHDTLIDEQADFLNTLASSLAISLENINFLAETHDKALIEAEINAAKAVQEALLPHYSEFPGLEISTFYQPASKTGGDWYGYFYDSLRHRLNFYIGDVTGHGIPSALLTGVACGSVYSAEEASILNNTHLGAQDSDHLARLVKVVNKIILQAGQQQLLMTMFFISLDLTTGEIEYVNAGHNPPFIHKVSTPKAVFLRGNGNRLGYTEDPEIRIKKDKMDPGDIAFLYTDGLVENRGPDGRVFLEKHVREIVGKEQTVQSLQDKILAEGRDVWKDYQPDDDVTMLLFRWIGPVSRSEVEAHLRSVAQAKFGTRIPTPPATTELRSTGDETQIIMAPTGPSEPPANSST